MSFIDRIAEAAVNDPRVKKINIKESFLRVWAVPGTTDAGYYIARDLLKAAGIKPSSSYAASYGSYFILAPSELDEITPKSYKEAKKRVSEAATALNALGSVFDKEQKRIRTLAANKAEKEWASTQWYLTNRAEKEKIAQEYAAQNKAMVESRPEFLINGKMVEVRD